MQIKIEFQNLLSKYVNSNTCNFEHTPTLSKLLYVEYILGNQQGNQFEKFTQCGKYEQNLQNFSFTFYRFFNSHRKSYLF